MSRLYRSERMEGGLSDLIVLVSDADWRKMGARHVPIYGCFGSADKPGKSPEKHVKDKSNSPGNYAVPTPTYVPSNSAPSATRDEQQGWYTDLIHEYWAEHGNHKGIEDVLSRVNNDHTPPAKPMTETTGANTVRCATENCPSIFRTDNPLAKRSLMVCKNHTRAAQLRAVNAREYKPIKYDDKGNVTDWGDHADEAEHFQDHIHDKKLRGTDPNRYEGENAVELPTKDIATRQGNVEQIAHEEVEKLEQKLRRKGGR